MAGGIVTRSGLSDVELLAYVIADEEGIGIKLARVLAELQYDELAAYAVEWDRACSRRTAPRQVIREDDPGFFLPDPEWHTGNPNEY